MSLRCSIGTFSVPAILAFLWSPKDNTNFRKNSIELQSTMAEEIDTGEHPYVSQQGVYVPSVAFRERFVLAFRFVLRVLGKCASRSGSKQDPDCGMGYGGMKRAWSFFTEFPGTESCLSASKKVYILLVTLYWCY